MNHAVYAESDTYPIAILVKASAFSLPELEGAYIARLESKGVAREKLIILALEYDQKGKASATHIKEQLDAILTGLSSVGTQYLYCADAKYFKVLTRVRKAEPNIGYSLPCAIPGYEHMQVILGVNHRSLLYNPVNEPKMLLSLDTLIDVVTHSYSGLGNNIIKKAEYPQSLEEIAAALEKLHQYPELSCDIETFSLKFDKAGIATITFCWSKHKGIAFACDYSAYPNDASVDGLYGEYLPNKQVQVLLRKFFETYAGTLKFHKANFDVGVLVYTLWMEHLSDTGGLLEGLEVLTANYHDTRIIAYLALNSTAGNELSLKELAHAFAGNWAQDDIKDIRKIALPQLLEYNLVDGLATNYVFETYYPKMLADNQRDIYDSLMMPSQTVIIQIELTGMPLDPIRVQEVKQILQTTADEHLATIAGSVVVAKLTDRLRHEAMDAANSKLKTKQHPLSKFADPDNRSYVAFNPNSNPQIQKLLYEELSLPVVDLTKTKQPATGHETLEKLINHTAVPEHLELLQALIGLAKAQKILSSFIPAFEQAIAKGDDVVWLHGSFNLGGTVSGRLSSSDPNLQNIPATSTYGKLIKSCFRAPRGWVFCGADFNSLEDYVSALQTKDPNKLKVYLDGYDGHCLRAFSYFPERLPGIVNTVESINSIADKFKSVRQDSKGPTFLLTYGGTDIGLHKTLGFPKAKAKIIANNYHELYKVSDEWVQARLEEASHRGFVELAFGLRLRTPLLAQTIRGNRTTPFEAVAEGRTAGNALGQSYGLLNNRAANEFMRRVWASKYRLDILPVALIHDATYLIMRDNYRVAEWVNENLIECMQWQELPEIAHDTVKLGAELSIFWPSWASEISIPNHATKEEIRTKCMDFHTERGKSQAA
jgi:DNA polymerase I